MTSSGSPRKTAFRLARWLIVAVLAVLLLPYLLTPLYRVIDPPSTLMLARWLAGQAGGAHLRAAGADRAGAAAHGDRVRGRPVLRPSRHRLGRASGGDRGRRRHHRGAGRLDHHPADRQEPVPLAGPQLRPQGPGVPAGALDRSGAAQAADHGNLSQHRRMGPERRIRRRGRRPPRLQQAGLAIVRGRGRAARPRCCPIRSAAAPSSRGRGSGASPASSRRGRPARARSTPVCGARDPEKGSSLGGGLPL